MLEDLTTRDVLTISISVAALALSYYTAMRASRLSSRQYDLLKRQGEAENRIGAMQAEVAREQTRLQRDTDIIRWANDTTVVLSEMAEIPMIEGDEEALRARRHELRHRLSAQIDIGRLYFPNSLSGLETPEDAAKPPAYRGERQTVLTHLIDAYDAFSESAVGGDAARRRLVKWRVTAEKRGFVSEIHEFIDPRRYVEFRDDGPMREIKAQVENGEEA